MIQADDLRALRRADPVTADDPSLAPDSPAAHRVHRAALARTAAPAARPVAPRPRPRGGRAGATAALLVAVLATGVLGGAGGVSTADARAALRTAVARTAGFSSGLLTIGVETRRTGAQTLSAMRFAGNDVSVDYTADGDGFDPRGGYAFVGGHPYERRGDGSWARTPDVAPVNTDGSTPPPDVVARRFAAQLDGAVAIAAAIRRAPGMTHDTQRGVTTYRADLRVRDEPAELGRAGDLDAPVTATATVGADGLVHTLTLAERERTVTIAYADLGNQTSLPAPAR
jgi:hypothetical protein